MNVEKYFVTQKEFSKILNKHITNLGNRTPSKINISDCYNFCKNFEIKIVDSENFCINDVSYDIESLDKNLNYYIITKLWNLFVLNARKNTVYSKLNKDGMPRKLKEKQIKPKTLIEKQKDYDIEKQKQREFWKHNLNPITGLPVSLDARNETYLHSSYYIDKSKL